MDFVRFLLNSNSELYHLESCSSDEMFILGLFLSGDVRPNDHYFREWALQSTDGDVVRGDSTRLENENGFFILSDEHPAISDPATLKVTVAQLVNLLDDWQKKVIKPAPKKVTIKHEHGEFYIETSD